MTLIRQAMHYMKNLEIKMITLSMPQIRFLPVSIMYFIYLIHHLKVRTRLGKVVSGEEDAQAALEHLLRGRARVTSHRLDTLGVIHRLNLRPE